LDNQLTPSEQTDVPALDRLVDYINHRRLSEGHRLPPIKELARELHLRPHAVRDVLLKAQTMGLVRVQPRSGCYVQSVSFESLVEVFSQSLPRTLNQQDRNLFDLLEARRLIEVELVGMAARRRRLADLTALRQTLRVTYEAPEDYEAYVTHNEEFHLGIAKIGGNEVLREVLRCLLVLLRPILGDRKPSTWKDEGSRKRERDAREHEAIFQALLTGDPVAARAAMAAHLQDTTESLLATPGRAGDAGT
jgi:GntR family transcriptional regulator, transcriptional repressor for pyruvate dehydrogenase complex